MDLTFFLMKRTIQVIKAAKGKKLSVTGKHTRSGIEMSDVPN